jgi:hypothetical protein
MQLAAMYNTEGKIVGLSYGPGTSAWVKAKQGERKLQLEHDIVEFDYPELSPDLGHERILELLDEILATQSVDVKASPPRVVSKTDR